MLNYFNYFTEIEQRFSQRRGSILMLSTIDWALIETWRDAGVPLEAVLRGIDNAFDKYDARSLRVNSRVRKVNGLAWCSQSVLEAAEAASEAAIGASSTNSPPPDTGFENDRIRQYLEANAAVIEAAELPAPADRVAAETAARLRSLAADLVSATPPSLEDLDRTLTALEEKLLAAMLTATPETELVGLREQADRELAPYRGKMGAVQIRQVHQQFLHKRLLEARALPRLSLFYMSLG
jgi:hypothetical protein